MAKKKHTMYGLAQSTIDGMQIGDVRIIPLPKENNLAFFRKYLSEIGKRTDSRYTTKTIDGKLQVMRINYFNIYSKKTE